MTTGNDHPGVVVPPPVIYLGFILFGWGLSLVLNEAGFGLAMEIRRGLALALIVGGLLLDGMAAGTFRRAGTAVEPWKPSSNLVDAGPYRFSRNPIYVGFAITYVGLAVAMDSPVTLALLFPCLMVIDRYVIVREERYLEARFGQAYRDYRARVRRWL